jgi:guanine deaminase
MEHGTYMKMAIQEAFDGMRSGDGGPFGAVIVRDGKILGRGHNSVLSKSDPTAHAEINAIRNACQQLQDHHLTGATIYTNFEPCPMCLAAIYWADIRKLYYCASRRTAEKAGFMDNWLYKEIGLPIDRREMEFNVMEHGDMIGLLDEWDDMQEKILY